MDNFAFVILLLCCLIGLNSCVGQNDTESDGGICRTLPRPEEEVHNDTCHLHAVDDRLAQRIIDSIGAGAKLIKYDINFPEYCNDPLSLNRSFIYKPRLWQRVIGEHGKTLLSLAFNYDILSLQMLTFGVERMAVDIIDYPQRCFQELSDSQKLKRIRELLLDDFQSHIDAPKNIDDNYVCQQMVVVDREGYADFQYECCSRTEDGDILCITEVQDKWINFLYTVIAIMKLGFFLLGPLVLQKWIYHHSIRKADYTVKLSDVLHKTIVVKKVKVYEKKIENVVDQKKDYPGQFDKFKKIVKAIPSEEIVPVSISRVHVQVDHKELIDDKSVPVGLLYYIWTNFFQCGLQRYEPFLSCCRESIVGSWDSRFLWVKLFPEGSQCNKSCRKYLSFGHITGLIVSLILMVAVAAPFAARITIYYLYEEPEILDRKAKIASLELSERIGTNLFHYFTPTHYLLIAMYVGYFFSFFVLVLYHAFDMDMFEEVVLGSLQDLRSISRLECLRLLISHMLLPFEKFGICAGLIVGCIYWTFAIPLCLITMLWYCIPTFYMTGRLTIQARPRFVKYSAVPYVPKFAPAQQRHPKNLWALDSLSLGITSIESCMMLNNISPNRHDDHPPSVFTTHPCKNGCTARNIWHEFTKVFLGLSCIVWMYSVLIMYAECFGFIVEGFVMILMGAVVNAGSAAHYIMVAFWAITYSISCYNECYERYMILNTKIFEYIKAKINDEIKKVTLLREIKQRYTAFKYFTKEDLTKEAQGEIEVDLDSNDELSITLGKPRDPVIVSTTEYEDSIEFIDGKLNWHVHHLVLFVDKKDNPRIPRKLFDRVCHIQAPGCPGPVYKGLLQATKKFMYMVVFLLFVVIVVMAFGSMYNVSSANQLLVTLAGGFVPFVIRFVLQPKLNSLNLNTYTFEGKIHEVFKGFAQTWPVHDLTFLRDEGDTHTSDSQLGESATEDAVRSQPIPRQVDLLITIRDEDETAPNLRSETASQRSHVGSQEIVRTTEPNNPSNATAPIAIPNAANTTYTGTDGGNSEELIPLNTYGKRSPSLENNGIDRQVSKMYGPASPTLENNGIDRQMSKMSSKRSPPLYNRNVDRQTSKMSQGYSERSDRHMSLSPTGMSLSPTEEASAAVHVGLDIDQHGEPQVRNLSPDSEADQTWESPEARRRTPTIVRKSVKYKSDEDMPRVV